MNLKSFDYNLPQNHVERRQGLSDALKKSLAAYPADPTRNSYQGEAQFWLQIHQGLLRTSATLPNWCQKFQNESDVRSMLQIAPRIADLAHQLVHHAHTHHHIEDYHFFPVFLHTFPQLANPLELLEKDHEILSVVLDDIEEANRRFRHCYADIKGKSDIALRDDFMRAADKLKAGAERLDRLFIRHISDEEEICLPLLMRM